MRNKYGNQSLKCTLLHPWVPLTMHWIYVDLCSKKPESSAGASNYIPQILWDVITCPRPWYLHFAHNSSYLNTCMGTQHYDVIKLKHFLRYWPFVRGIHRSPVNSSHKGQWREALIFSLICALKKRLSKQSRGWWFDSRFKDSNIIYSIEIQIFISTSL